MAGAERERPRLPPALPLATLIGRELRVWGSERPTLRYGHAGFAKRGEEYFLVKPDCLRVSGDPSTVFAVFAVFDGHHGVSEAVFSKEHLLEHVMSALPPDIGGRDGWLQALPRALVVDFVKADIDFQCKGRLNLTALICSSKTTACRGILLRVMQGTTSAGTCSMRSHGTQATLKIRTKL